MLQMVKIYIIWCNYIIVQYVGSQTAVDDDRDISLSNKTHIGLVNMLFNNQRNVICITIREWEFIIGWGQGGG